MIEFFNLQFCVVIVIAHGLLHYGLMLAPGSSGIAGFKWACVQRHSNQLYIAITGAGSGTIDLLHFLPGCCRR